MTFVSYAQNAEDVILWRALNDIERGFYIDVGAYDPTVHSVTRAFYERGWRGINVEPVPEYFENIRRSRPNDININGALGESSGVMTFHIVRETGLSTLDAGVAQKHETEGRTVDKIVTPVLTLASLWESTSPETVHFLKIDVEGAERQVLAGADFQRFRPWIIVVEATVPLSTQRNDQTWRKIIEQAGYDAIFFDGLNLYFLAREHADLRDRLAVPANVFDEYETADVHGLRAAHASLQAGNAELMVRIGSTEAVNAELMARIASAETAHGELTAQIASIQAVAADRIGSLEASLTERESKIRGLMSRLRATATTLAERERRIADLAETAQRYQRIITKYRSADASRDLAAGLAVARHLRRLRRLPLRLIGQGKKKRSNSGLVAIPAAADGSAIAHEETLGTKNPLAPSVRRVLMDLRAARDQATAMRGQGIEG